MPARVTLHVVPHTHWDREWYEPFEVYRTWLVKAMDRLIEILETDPGFRHFNLDGQTAAIEDYLEVRPEREERLAALVRSGRLAIAPWRILMDEFLCSPETIVRNLQQGRATAERLGRGMHLGYIPDSFGHISQMPQILQLAGHRDACVWRGVPSAVDRTAFWWEAPDGSRMRTLYLATSYSNAASLPEGFEELMVRAKRILGDLASFKPGRVTLAMNGTDHRAPEPHLPALFAEANGRQRDVEFRIGSLEEYLEEAPFDRIPTWRGELRSGARANLLMGVASARMPLKRAEFRASTLLERYAEPLAAVAGRDWGQLVPRAWRWMVENSAHDSVCGCGIDAVAEQVEARYVQAARIGETVARDGLEALAARVEAPGDGILLFNPSPFARPLVAEVTARAPEGGGPFAFRTPRGREIGAQVVTADQEVVVDMTLDAAQLGRIVPTIHSRTIGQHFINALRIEEGDPATVHLSLGTHPEGTLDVEAGKRAVEEAIAANPGGRFRVLALAQTEVRAVVRTPKVEGLGWILLEQIEPTEPLAPTAEAPPIGGDPALFRKSARATTRVLENMYLRAEVRADGSLDVLHTATGVMFEGLLSLEDDGDAGDEYNYSPPERDEVVIVPAAPAGAEALEQGPLRGALRVTTEWIVPAGLAARGDSRSEETVTLPVSVDLALQAGEPFLRARIAFDNTARDHRLRANFPLPFRTSWSHADGAFDVVRRGLEGEGGPHERGLPTFPCRRWVDASDGRMGLAILHRGAPEYELVGGRAIAITLLRSVGMLSRQGMRYRAGPAGPAMPTPGAQCLGRHVVDLAILPHEGDWRLAQVHRAAETFCYEPWSVPVRAHAGNLPLEGGALAIEPSSVQLSALVRDERGVFARVYNASSEPVQATLRIGPPLEAAFAAVCDLFGAEQIPLAVTDGLVALPLRPWEIATVRLS